MPLALKNLHRVDSTSFDYFVEFDVDVPLRTAKPNTADDPLLIRANIYRPKADGQRYPVLVTCGPYGKDIPYHQFHEESFSHVNPKQKSPHSAWEVPDPGYWTSQGYAVVRADERGTGNSPGKLDSLGPTVWDGFADLIEWAADRAWSNGKVGLLGISYYAASQWSVAARQPRGLSCMIPWEGMTDYYRDRARHGGIMSNGFIKYVYNRQVASSQYGLPGKAERNWGPDTLEGSLTPEELAANRADQHEDAAQYRFRDEAYYQERDFDLSKVQVPLMSAVNWGAIHLHLRGSVMGYLGASSQFKYLYFLTGRHDLPFFYDESVELQRSFLDACLKGEDREGWLVPGKVAPVNLCLRRGNPGFSNPEAERRMFPRRTEQEWPLARTKYTDYHLHSDGTLGPDKPSKEAVTKWEALTSGSSVRFKTTPAEEEIEITGHPWARLSVGASPLNKSSTQPSEIDLFLTLRHYDAANQEIFYTGAAGDAVPVVRGWQRVSLRKTVTSPGVLGAIMPERNYYSTEVQEVVPRQVYNVDVEIWPTSVVLLPGETLELQVSGTDSENSGIFQHDHPEDRPREKLLGYNEIHIGPQHENFLKLPIIPEK